MDSATEGVERVGCSGAEVEVGAASVTTVWAPESEDAASREMLSILGASSWGGGGHLAPLVMALLPLQNWPLLADFSHAKP